MNSINRAETLGSVCVAWLAQLSRFNKKIDTRSHLWPTGMNLIFCLTFHLTQWKTVFGFHFRARKNNILKNQTKQKQGFRLSLPTGSLWCQIPPAAAAGGPDTDDNINLLKPALLPRHAKNFIRGEQQFKYSKKRQRLTASDWTKNWLGNFKTQNANQLFRYIMT